MKIRLKEYIDNIEQLGADARFEYNRDRFDLLRTKLTSIITWCNMAIVLLNRLEKGIDK